MNVHGKVITLVRGKTTNCFELRVDGEIIDVLSFQNQIEFENLGKTLLEYHSELFFPFNK